MKRLQLLYFIAVFLGYALTGQEIDLYLDSPESGNQTHEARNSITFAPGYSYTMNGGTMSASIVDPFVIGTVSYSSTPVDPETRTLNTSYLTGATNGSFNLNAMGGASYTIPIETLPGVNGLSPSISLVYSSNGGPGIAGYGWQIAGISLIGRGPKTYYHDGTTKGIELDTTDRFYLDGQRLVNGSYYYGHENAKYFTENDIFTRVKPKETSEDGPSWFTAETKSGLIYEYGNSSGSKQLLDGYSEVLNWYVSTISDFFNNEINFTYFKDNGFVYPGEITYGPNKITFYYKERSDKISSYIKGSKIEQRYILDKIKISYNGNIVKTYEFKYNYKGSYYNKYSILNEVIEYGTGTDRLNSTAFTYIIPDNVSFSLDCYNLHPRITNPHRIFNGDFNGDGKADIFWLPGDFYTDCWIIYKNIGDGNFQKWLYGSNPPDRDEIIGAIIIDLNGDNCDDVIVMCQNPIIPALEYWYALMDNGSLSDFICAQFISSFNIEYNKYPDCTDIDGDGLNDFINLFGNGNWAIFSYDYENSQNHFPLKYSGDLGFSLDSEDKAYISDFNGDGKGDLWYFNSSSLAIYTLNNYGTLSQIYYATNYSRNQFFTLGDYNGDGKTDLFLYGHKNGGTEYDWDTWYIRLSTGDGFISYEIPKKKDNLKDDIIKRGDFNGDGCTDLLIGVAGGQLYYIPKNFGTDFYSYSYPSGPSPLYNYYIDDYNGDGREEYLCIGSDEFNFYGYLMYSAPGKTNILMEKVGDGLGNLTKLSYTKLSQAPNTIYQRGTGALFPVTDFQGPITVVDTVRYDNGTGSMNLQTCYYEGIKIHLQGKGFLGYSKTSVTDVTSNITSVSTYDYNTTYYYPYLSKITKKYDNQDLIEKTENNWSHIVLDANKKRIFPYIQSTSQTNGLTGHSVTTSFSYDNYGNPTIINKNYGNDITEQTTNTYSNIIILFRWLLGRPVSSTIQYADNDTSFTRTVYRTFNSLDNNMLDKTSLPGTSMELIHRYEYNSNGTLQSDSIGTGSIWRTKKYTYEDNNIRIQTITDPLSHTLTYTYDSYGRLSTKEDHLNNTITYSYDALGRQTSASSTDGDQTTTSYNWTGTNKPTLGVYSITNTKNDGSVTNTWYDELGCEIRSDVKGFDGTMIYSVSEYNTKGQLYRVSEPYFSGGSPTDWNVYSYDDYGRKNGLTRPSGRNTSWTYADSTITETTAGKSFYKTYSANGTLISASDNGGSISYSYLPDGNPETITAPGSIVTSMKYDVAGNQTRLVDPSAGTLNYTFNAFGELTSQQNARGQTTSISYYDDGRINQKTTPEGTTSYTYNASKQITGISSPGNVSRTYTYDSKGRVSTVSENINGTNFSTSFTYDIKGRLSTTTHPSGIVETNTYNNNGYLASISAGGTTRWINTSMNERLQLTGGTYGSNLNVSYGFDSYGYPVSTVTGSVQNFQYNFNTITGNLNWRKKVFLQDSIQENFTYDNLDRLDLVTRGGNTVLDMSYGTNAGIQSKSDAGTFQYSLPEKPYAISGIDPSTGLILGEQYISYTSFEKVSTISEEDYFASFLYNQDEERARMEIKQNGNTILTRWYPTGSYMKEISGGATKEYTYIGGDAYSAPVIAVTQNGETDFYYLLRDYLGNITHQVDVTKSVVAEWSYDAWGRLRNTSTWDPYDPESEPALLAGRGYTGHEHLPWFNLINMNGRVYDPLTGMFLSPDNFIQMPDFTQNFNRYGYALNNPLVYTDPDGEWAWLVPALIQAYLNYNSAIESGLDKGQALAYAVTNFIGSAASSLINIPGIIPNTAFHAGTNIINNGISNSIVGRNFFENWGTNALLGSVSGGFTGYQLAKWGYLNYWWGTPSYKWGYNRNQWSLLPWWTKPDKSVFKGVKNYGKSEINCMAKSFQNNYGNTEQYWNEFTNEGSDRATQNNIRNSGGQVMMYPSDHEMVSFENILDLSLSEGGRAMITFDNYKNTGEGHALTVKKVFGFPRGRLDLLLFDPFDGRRIRIRDFTQGTNLGTNLRFWFIYFIN